MIEATVEPPRRAGLFKNLIILYAAQLATGILSLVPLTFVPVYLDTVGVGKLTFAISFTGLFGTLMILGTPTYIVREIARDHRRIAEIVSNAIILRILLAAILLPAAAVTLYLLDYPATTRTVALIMYAGLTIRVISFTFALALQALENATWRSLAVVTKEAVAVTIGWLALRQGAGIVTYVLVLAFADIVEFAINAAYFIFVYPLRPTIRWSGVIAIFRGGMPFFLWAFLQTIYMQASSLMLSKLGGEQAVGLFGAASPFVTQLLMIPTVAVTVLLPRLSQMHITEPGAMRQAVARSTNYMTIITMPLAFGLCAVAGRVIDLFGYPADFQASIPVLQVLAFNLPGTALLMVMATAVSAMNKERAWAKISLFSVAALIGLNAGMIPVTKLYLGNAAIGAAVADLIAEVLTLALTLRLMGRTMVDPNIFFTFGKVMLAGGAMAAVALSLAWLPLPVVIAIGAVVYAGLALVLKVVPAEELRAARAVVARRLGRRDVDR